MTSLALPSALARSKLFPEFCFIKCRADRILRDRTLDEVEGAAIQIKGMIADFKKKLAAKTPRKAIQRLFFETWDSNGPHSVNSATSLTNSGGAPFNWVRDVTRTVRDLDALGELIAEEASLTTLNVLPVTKTSELYAILALTKLVDADQVLQISEAEEADLAQECLELNVMECSAAIQAANLIIEAMEIIDFAQRDISVDQLRRMRSQDRDTLAKTLEREVLHKHARKGGVAKNFKSAEARRFVVLEWANHADAYDRNKSAFARIYVRLVLQKFEVKITEKQIREVWLKGPLPAGTPAGVQANG